MGIEKHNCDVQWLCLAVYQMIQVLYQDAESFVTLHKA